MIQNPFSRKTIGVSEIFGLIYHQKSNAMYSKSNNQNEGTKIFNYLEAFMMSNEKQKASLNKTPAMHRDIFRLQLANKRHLIKNLPPPR